MRFSLNGILSRVSSRRSASTLITLGVSIGVGLFAGSTANAINGYIAVIGCGTCQTSTDFINAAKNNANGKSVDQTGVSFVPSWSVPRSAFVKITGVMLEDNRNRLTFHVSSAVPVDAAGNSLSGQSESTLQSDFTAFDQLMFAGSRKDPVGVSVSSEYASSFINSDDAEVGPGIDNALLGTGVNWSSLPLLQVIKVTFSDGTTALFVKTSSSLTDHWSWTGVAQKNGQLINRNGSTRTNPNTSGGASGSSSGSGFPGDPGLPSGTRFQFKVSAAGKCILTTTVTDPTGQEFVLVQWIGC